LGAREQALEAKERSLEQTWERKYAAKLRELEQRAGEMAAQFERRAQAAIEELSQRAVSQKVQAKISKTKREYQEAVASLAPPSTAAVIPRPKISEGVRVRLKGIRQPATVRRISGDLLDVEAGFLKMRVPTSEVEEVLPASDAPARASGIAFHQGPSFETSYREINLIGQRAEEACGNVEKFLDSAALAQVDKIRIIHGHGMGILKRAVADLLKENPHVAKFYVAPPEEGGSGATIVELK
jgi:DNA mismatch repair protein MutS2